ncbi:hypothetical protein EMCRGX_G020901 [Ephydatia muelleri]
MDMSSDRGSQFTSQLWSSVAKLLGITLHHTTAYHPQANGLVERFHRHLKTSLRARLTGPQWAQELPWVLLGIRTAPKEDLGCSSTELVYGAPVTVPGEFFPAHTSQPNHNSELQRLREQVQALVPIPTSHHGITPISIPPDLQHSHYVFIRRDSHRTPLQRPYEGPFKVLQPGEKNFTIDIGGRKDTVLVDRLKLAHIDPEFQVPVAVAKHRGRPPRKVQPTSTQSHTPDSLSDIPLPLHTRSDARRFVVTKETIYSRGGMDNREFKFRKVLEPVTATTDGILVRVLRHQPFYAGHKLQAHEEHIGNVPEHLVGKAVSIINQAYTRYKSGD